MSFGFCAFFIKYFEYNFIVSLVNFISPIDSLDILRLSV